MKTISRNVIEFINDFKLNNITNYSLSIEDLNPRVNSTVYKFNTSGLDEKFGTSESVIIYYTLDDLHEDHKLFINELLNISIMQRIINNNPYIRNCFHVEKSLITFDEAILVYNRVNNSRMNDFVSSVFFEIYNYVDGMDSVKFV